MNYILPAPLCRSATRLALAALTLLVVACSDSNNNSNPPEVVEPPPENTGPGNIVEVAVEADGFETLVTALQATGLDATLADETATFTVFAPTDDAFAALGQDTVDALLADTDTLSDILLYHVIAEQAVDSDTALSLAGTTVETANGDIVALTIRDGELFINEARVVTTDIEASNGVIHVIDAVLQPPEDQEPAGNIVEVAVAAGDFTTLVAAVQAAGLDGLLADPDQVFTVFAPTDEAFAALGQDTINALLADIPALTNILLYHVIAGSAVDSITATSLIGQSVETANGTAITAADTLDISVREGELFVNDSRLVVRDIPATNGVIHVIDAVLVPPADEPGTIVDVAVANGNFTTLVTALQTAGLDATLADTTSTFTVFAPTDEAFALLGDTAINELLADTDALSNVLLYHVLTDQIVDSTTALTLNGSMVEMANGDTVTVSVVDGELFINDSQVVAADVAASNGVIHVIDAVLMPPM